MFENVIVTMANVKVLYLDAIVFRAKAEVFAKSLFNLEEICGYTDSVDVIMPFVYHPPTLRKIDVNKTFFKNPYIKFIWPN